MEVYISSSITGQNFIAESSNFDSIWAIFLTASKHNNLQGIQTTYLIIGD